MMPALAPTSTAIFDSVIRSLIDKWDNPDPANSRHLYVAPSPPRILRIFNEISLAKTPGSSLPKRSTLMLFGTRNQISPIAQTPAISVLLIGIPTAFNAIQRRLGFEDAMKQGGLKIVRQ